jgi:excinuclease ABC subunit A
MNEYISIRGARLHNLKNIDLDIPKNQLVVLTGLSGSGKSTLGFDILNKEGMRQYMESLGMISHGLSKPPVDSISGLSPTISIDQHISNHSPRSTVGTATEIYTYLRVLFARLGHRPCPHCGLDVPPSFDLAENEADEIFIDEESISSEEATYPCPHCGKSIPEIGMAHFSFNKPEGACPTCTGLGAVHQVNIKKLADENKSILDGAVYGWDIHYIKHYTNTLNAAEKYYGLEFDLSLPIKEFNQIQHDLFFYGVNDPRFRRHFPDVEPPTTVNHGRFEGIATNVLRRYGERINDVEYREKLEEFMFKQTCPDCQGTRLKPDSRTVTVNAKTIIQLSQMPLTELGVWLQVLPDSLNALEQKIAEAILSDLHERISRLTEVGAGYLTMERSSPSLSAGEAQRLRLASLLGSSLTGLLYVFDEPTIGLHQRDTLRLINVLKRLRDLGNTVLVIEHDLEMIEHADFVIDFGPGAGKHGGQLVASGTPQQLLEQNQSLTAAYLKGERNIPLPSKRRLPNGNSITIHAAYHHNLQNIDVEFPLGLFLAVTGVSGSGKSSLVFDILDKALRKHLYAAGDEPGEHASIEGLEHITKIITIDQQHIARIPRSNAATYTDTFTPIRKTFASTPEAHNLGLTARHFSFNVPGGRCERCEGTGMLTVKMHFMPDVEVICPTCHGKRFTKEVLAVKYRDHDISQVLELTVEEALQLFQEVPAARSRLQVLNDVGLGYLQLGQPATTLSGGEAQRIKLSKELGRRGNGHTLYLLDEPTTGLHIDDISRLLLVLQRLVDAGNSVFVVEHNLEVIKTADWVIDLGPEGGSAGGKLIATGTPEQVATVESSFTGQYLKTFFVP